MSACQLTTDIVDSGIKIKECLKKLNYGEEATIIDTFLCQYEYRNLSDKQELISSILYTFTSKRLQEMFVSKVLFEDIVDFCNCLRVLMNNLQEEMKEISFDKFLYNDKEYIVKRDVFSYIIMEKCMIVLLKENGKYFEDNLVAIDHSGKLLWGSSECIDCKDRSGACFVRLRELSGDVICAHAFVGVNYFINSRTGKVLERKIVR